MQKIIKIRRFVEKSASLATLHTTINILTCQLPSWVAIFNLIPDDSNNHVADLGNLTSTNQFTNSNTNHFDFLDTQLRSHLQSRYRQFQRPRCWLSKSYTRQLIYKPDHYKFWILSHSVKNHPESSYRGFQQSRGLLTKKILTRQILHPSTDLKTWPFPILKKSSSVSSLDRVIQQTEHRPFNCVPYADCRMW